MALSFVVPSQFANTALYERFGAIIKEKASGSIVGHVQQLQGWDLTRGLSLPGSPLELGLDAIQNVQLHYIQQTLNTVQTLATVGAVASVATLGVCAVGFAMVLKKLKRMEGKLDQVLSQVTEMRGLVQDLNIKVDALPLARLQARLETIELARHFGESRRRSSLERAIEDLAELKHYYATLLASEQFCALGTDHMMAILDTQERLVATCEAELFAEFLLSGDPVLLDQRLIRQTQLLESSAWTSPLSLYKLAERGDKAAGKFLVTSPELRKGKARDLAAIRVESMSRLSSWPSIARQLDSQGTSPMEYLQQVEQLNATSQSAVLVWDCRPS